jgi:hypothetical protein
MLFFTRHSLGVFLLRLVENPKDLRCRLTRRMQANALVCAQIPSAISIQMSAPLP